MYYRSPFQRGLKFGLFLAALLVLAWLIWGKGMFNNVFSGLDKPTETKIEKTETGSSRKSVESRLGDPKSTEANCSLYESREGPTYRLCFKQGKLRTIKPEAE